MTWDMRMAVRGAFIAGCLAWLGCGAPAAAQEQVVDEAFRAVVEAPAYPQGGPTVAIDEAHANFHTAAGRYRPFADLLGSDGYLVRASADRFTWEALAGIDVLVIANALPQDPADPTQPAFADEECDAVRDWVRAGGALLLIADHAPFGSAAARLAGRFGVTMGEGWVFDLADTSGITTQLAFTRANGLLGDHPIVRGRGASEEIRHVATFTGQSLGVPPGASVLLALGPGAREAQTRDDLAAEDAAARGATEVPEPLGARSAPVGGRAQGLAMSWGEGRVVVLGEAGFLSAQVIRWPDGSERRFGMNVPGHDNRQFAVNVLHWLSRLLD